MTLPLEAAIVPIVGPPGGPPASAPTNASAVMLSDPVVESTTQETVRATSAGSCVRETVVVRQHASGATTLTVRGLGVTELATGLNRHTGIMKLQRSQAVAHLANGSLVVEGLPVTYRFATNVNSQVVVEQRKADGLRSRSALAGLVYLDYRSGRSVLLAVPQNAGAQWTGRDVVYSNAFGGLDADIVYRVRPSGLEQDVILRDVPPSPASCGLADDATRLCILTELVGERPDRVRVDSPAERNAFLPSPEPLALLRVEGPKLREIANYETGWAFGRDDHAAIGGTDGTAVRLRRGRDDQADDPIGRESECMFLEFGTAGRHDGNLAKCQSYAP